jgi:magnesium chelatase family protein
MLARVFSCAVVGLDGEIIEVEVDTHPGLPRTIIVGLPDAAVQESRERVQTAIQNSGCPFPRKRIIINLAPASVRKAGPAYDLPIAVGILISSGILPKASARNALIIGELSLDGSVRHVRGVLSMTATAREAGYQQIFVPAINAAEAALIPDIDVIPVQSLASLLEHLRGASPLQPQPATQPETLPLLTQTDFQEVKGQEHVKRALEIAAAGQHNVLMTGPPGTGKTLMARALPGILPRLQIEEALDVTRVYSIADQLGTHTPLVQARPFRAPHHTVSHAGLAGGGNWPQPGEISLAHHGVLFLDELPEFGKQVLEVLRQPLEDKVVTISRAQGSLTFPANFQLIAAMNPCPCGYAGDPERSCSCSSHAITRYRKRISGPLLDRFDIHIEVPRVDFEKLSEDRLGEPSLTIRQRVEAAREVQIVRFCDGSVRSNSGMSPKHLRSCCPLDETGTALMRSAMLRMQLSARAYHRILKLARTIADLAAAESITPNHLAEALQYRPKLLY